MTNSTGYICHTDSIRKGDLLFLFWGIRRGLVSCNFLFFLLFKEVRANARWPRALEGIINKK